MKIALKTILFGLCFVGAVLAIAMAAIEARIIFSGDWIVCSTSTNGLVRYLARFCLSVFGLTVAVTEIANIFKKSKELSTALLASHISLLAAFTIISVFSSNFIGLITTLLSLIIISVKTVLARLEI